MRAVSGGGVDYAIEATGRTEAMQAAFLSTRARGAAVLIGIPRPDAVLTLPALSIPRMERRVLGSIYGSTYPERDFALTLDLYRRGRLPLDRLITHRVPLEELERGFDLLRNGEAIRAVVDDGGGDREPGCAGRDDRAGLGRAEPEREPRQRRPREARQPHGGGGDRACSPTRPRATRR